MMSDEIDGIGIVDAKEIEKAVGLRAAGSEMDVGDKQSAKVTFGSAFAHNLSFHARANTKIM